VVKAVEEMKQAGVKMLRDKEWREIDGIIYKEGKVYVPKDEKLRCHKLHSAISPPILRRFPQSQSERKALKKTFRSIPVTSRSNQYWLRY